MIANTYGRIQKVRKCILCTMVSIGWPKYNLLVRSHNSTIINAIIEVNVIQSIACLIAKTIWTNCAEANWMG